MPLINSTFKSKGFGLKNPHTQTIFHAFGRRVNINYKRERFTTPDNDFFDVDFLRGNSKKLCILIHGMESDTSRSYMKGMARTFNDNDYDVAAINFRGCSGEINNLYKSYHSGFYHDFKHLIDNESSYEEIYLLGFSLGGNSITQYLLNTPDKRVKKACLIATPLDLKASADVLHDPKNKLYCKRFLKNLKQKYVDRCNHLDLPIDQFALDNCTTFFDYDNLYTAPAHGFSDAFDYYEQNSSRKVLSEITTPLLIISAQDDPMISSLVDIVPTAKKSPFIYLNMPKHGGHIGFISKWGFEKYFWHETEALNFFNQ